MGFQLSIGACVIAAALLVQAAFILFAHSFLKSLMPRMVRPDQGVRCAVLMVSGALWMMASHALGVWVWALLFLTLGVFEAFEPAIYFAVVAFTTLGYGDVILGSDWRLLGGLCAANGLFAFGLSTAFLVDFFGKLQAQDSEQL